MVPTEHLDSEKSSNLNKEDMRVRSMEMVSSQMEELNSFPSREAMPIVGSVNPALESDEIVLQDISPRAVTGESYNPNRYQHSHHVQQQHKSQAEKQTQRRKSPENAPSKAQTLTNQKPAPAHWKVPQQSPPTLDSIDLHFASLKKDDTAVPSPLDFIRPIPTSLSSGLTSPNLGNTQQSTLVKFLLSKDRTLQLQTDVSEINSTGINSIPLVQGHENSSDCFKETQTNPLLRNIIRSESDDMNSLHDNDMSCNEQASRVVGNITIASPVNIRPIRRLGPLKNSGDVADNERLTTSAEQCLLVTAVDKQVGKPARKPSRNRYAGGKKQNTSSSRKNSGVFRKRTVAPATAGNRAFETSLPIQHWSGLSPSATSTVTSGIAESTSEDRIITPHETLTSEPCGSIEATSSSALQNPIAKHCITPPNTTLKSPIAMNSMMPSTCTSQSPFVQNSAAHPNILQNNISLNEVPANENQQLVMTVPIEVIPQNEVSVITRTTPVSDALESYHILTSCTDTSSNNMEASTSRTVAVPSSNQNSSIARITPYVNHNLHSITASLREVVDRGIDNILRESEANRAPSPTEIRSQLYGGFSSPTETVVLEEERSQAALPKQYRQPHYTSSSHVVHFMQSQLQGEQLKRQHTDLQYERLQQFNLPPHHLPQCRVSHRETVQQKDVQLKHQQENPTLPHQCVQNYALESNTQQPGKTVQWETHPQSQSQQHQQQQHKQKPKAKQNITCPGYSQQLDVPEQAAREQHTKLQQQHKLQQRDLHLVQQEQQQQQQQKQQQEQERLWVQQRLKQQQLHYQQQQQQQQQKAEELLRWQSLEFSSSRIQPTQQQKQSLRQRIPPKNTTSNEIRQGTSTMRNHQVENNSESVLSISSPNSRMQGAVQPTGLTQNPKMPIQTTDGDVKKEGNAGTGSTLHGIHVSISKWLKNCRLIEFQKHNRLNIKDCARFNLCK